MFASELKYVLHMKKYDRRIIKKLWSQPHQKNLRLGGYAYCFKSLKYSNMNMALAFKYLGLIFPNEGKPRKKFHMNKFYTLLCSSNNCYVDTICQMFFFLSCYNLFYMYLFFNLIYKLWIQCYFDKIFNITETIFTSNIKL